METIGIAAFTDRGRELAQRIARGLEKDSCRILWYEKDLKGWCASCFQSADALIFVGASGIAVRTIAPFLKSKTEDPAVLVLDEAGQYVISLLSGHIGGANEYALRISRLTGAKPVITTASDVRGRIAVDVFAKKNHLKIGSMKAAKEVAAAILRGGQVGLCCTGEIEGRVPPELMQLAPERKSLAGTGQLDCLIWISGRSIAETYVSYPWKIFYGTDGEPFLQREAYTADREVFQHSIPILHLIPRVVTVGIGCRRGKEAAAIEPAVRKALVEAFVPMEAVCGAASIDLKKQEQGILAVCGTFGIPFETYTAEELNQVPGTFSGSEFVKKTTGVDNVCERAALALAGGGGRLLRKKYAADGVTVALAVKKWSVRFP